MFPPPARSHVLWADFNTRNRWPLKANISGMKGMPSSCRAHRAWPESLLRFLPQRVRLPGGRGSAVHLGAILGRWITGGRFTEYPRRHSLFSLRLNMMFPAPGVQPKCQSTKAGVTAPPRLCILQKEEYLLLCGTSWRRATCLAEQLYGASLVADLQFLLASVSLVSSSKPRVSIGLPVYNGEHYLAEALESLLGQTYRDFEVIICDNASTDNTGRDLPVLCWP